MLLLVDADKNSGASIRPGQDKVKVKGIGTVSDGSKVL